jgi:hypothetical protein
MNYGLGFVNLEDEERLCYHHQFILETVCLVLKQANFVKSF